mgnify:CR=1 FL=1
MNATDNSQHNSSARPDPAHPVSEEPRERAADRAVAEEAEPERRGHGAGAQES